MIHSHARGLISHISPRFRRFFVAALLLLSCSTAAFAQHSIGHGRCCGRQDVILIRGGAGYWPGAQDMADHFQRLGYMPTVIFGIEYAMTADAIAEAVSEGRMAGGVVIVGYSSGADYACLMASRLQNYGIRVQTMVLIESTLGVTVPANVDYCANFYGSRRFDAVPMFRGIPVEVAGSQTILYNINVKQHSQYAEMAARNHFTIANTEQIRQTAGTIVAQRQPAVLVPSTPSPPASEPTPETPVVGSSVDLPPPQ